MPADAAQGVWQVVSTGLIKPPACLAGMHGT